MKKIYVGILVALILLAVCVCFVRVEKRPVTPVVSPQYDLTLTSVTYSPSSVKVGDKVLFAFSIENIGPDLVPNDLSYDFEIRIDGKTILRPTVKPDTDAAWHVSIAGKTLYSRGFHKHAGQARIASYTWSLPYSHFIATKAGPINYELALDPDNRAKETCETNNTVSGIIQVQPASAP